MAITAAVAVVMTACKNSPVATKEIPSIDTIGLAQFQAWKAMNERVDPAQMYATTTTPKVTKTSGTKSGAMTSSTTNNAKTTKKKGWSKAAKYSAIGGGTGVVLGAIINKKNRVAGGVIGGVLGGGLGYGIGRSQDKKDGRY